jgi:CheY-like chemotaxis protein
MEKKKGSIVMIVDDEESIRLLVESILKEEGYEVVSARSGKECLKMLEKVKPDLILLDIMMSKMTGLDVAEKIRKSPGINEIKIIFLTVLKGNDINPTLLKNLRVTDYITKPFDNTDLLRRVALATSDK